MISIFTQQTVEIVIGLGGLAAEVVTQDVGGEVQNGVLPPQTLQGTPGPIGEGLAGCPDIIHPDGIDW